jgi:signal-transduction protein with cAMP-binding, CBS, and nucleotidyltransferase domain
LTRGVVADNQLSLSELSHFEQRQLKDAFGVVHALQTVLGQRHPRT